ncbi:toxin-antitoxin system TumE family protein [Archaeoglobus sp.]
MTEILKEVAKKLLDYDIVLKVEFLGTKVRACLVHGYVLDVYYNQTLGKYSYTLIKESKRIVGWDNAPHHVSVETYPDHFHDVDGKIKPSYLSGDPLKDLNKVLNVIMNIFGLRR